MNIHSSHLVINNVSKQFDSTRALDSASLSVLRGETLAVLGPSGCGKTTLLRVIAGLEAPENGSVALGGSMLVDETTFVPPERRKIGMVFQGGALFPHMTVAQNVAYGLPNDGDRDSRVAGALAMVDLRDLGDRMPDSLSGGQAQRVALARALAPQPEVLLLDEPFASLDSELRIKVRAEVATLLRELEITAVFVTHDQEEAFVVGDHVAVMFEGSVVQVGTPRELYQRPKSAWIARFVGEANVLAGVGSGLEVATAMGMLTLADPVEGPCQVVVRPEFIQIALGDMGQIELVEFYGHDTAYRISVDGVSVSARAMSAPRFSVGDSVALSHDGPDVVAYPVAELSPTA